MIHKFMYTHKNRLIDAWEWDRDNFFYYVEKTPSCWIWHGCKSEDGYGRFTSKHLGKRLRAHRFSWFLKYGEEPINFGCHHCDNPICVNPNHLFDGTHSDNAKDMGRKGRHYLQVNPMRAMFGNANNKTKLNPDNVKDIRLSHLAGQSVGFLSRRMGISRQGVKDIITGKNWWLVHSELIIPEPLKDRWGGLKRFTLRAE